MGKQLFLYSILLINVMTVSAQSFTTNIRLSKDTIKLGEPVQVSVSVTYPLGKQLLFPDSLYNFHPLTFLEKHYFPTSSTDSTSTDSAIFTLTSFELQSPQVVKTPVFLITKNDTITISSDSLIIHIQEVIDSIPEKIQLQENTNIIPLQKKINYTLLAIIGGLVLVIILIVLLLFGGKVVRAIQIKRIEKAHVRFKEVFEKQIEEVEKNPALAEALIGSWKSHLTKISKHPYTSYSTSEIFQITKNEQLKQDLRLFDQLIYSSAKQSNVMQAKNSLLDFAEEAVKNRVNQIKQHGGKR